MMKSFGRFTLQVFLSIVAAGLSQGAVAFDNLTGVTNTSTSNSFQDGAALLMGNTPVVLSNLVFLQYTAAAGDLYKSDETFAIYARNTNGTVGTLLYGASSFTLTNTANGHTTVTPTVPITLAANTGYYFAVAETNEVVWDYTSTTTYTANYGITIPTTDASFQVGTNGVYSYYNLSDGPQVFEVNTVPEPSTWVGCGLTLAVAGWTLHRRKAFARCA